MGHLRLHDGTVRVFRVQERVRGAVGIDIADAPVPVVVFVPEEFQSAGVGDGDDPVEGVVDVGRPPADDVGDADQPGLSS